MLIGIAIVFGGFRIWQEMQAFFRSGGLPASVVTQQARTTSSPAPADIVSTRFPTATLLPPCEMYLVNADSVNVRSQPSTLAQVIEIISNETEVCVLSRDGEWYLVDRDTRTRRLEEGYIFVPLLRSLNPTSTPLPTSLPAATITLTFTPTITLTPRATNTP